MNHAISFANAQARWDNMLPPDDSRDEAAFDAACKHITEDPDRLLEAVYETDCDEAEKLADLRIVLRNAHAAIDMLTHGYSLDVAMNLTSNADAMRALFRAVNDADVFVSARITEAAEALL